MLIFIELATCSEPQVSHLRNGIRIKDLNKSWKITMIIMANISPMLSMC